MDTPPIRPLRDHVIVKADLPPEKSPGGIFLPDSVHMGRGTGEAWPGLVVAVGPEVRDPGLLVGCRVLFEKIGGTWVDGDFEGDRLKAIREGTILGVLEDG